MSSVSTELGSENGASRLAPGYELEKEKSSLLEKLAFLKKDFDQAAHCMSAQEAVRISKAMDEHEDRVAAINEELQKLAQDTPRPFLGPFSSNTPPG